MEHRAALPQPGFADFPAAGPVLGSVKLLGKRQSVGYPAETMEHAGRIRRGMAAIAPVGARRLRLRRTSAARHVRQRHLHP
ncbi:hypothetical protein MPLB_1820092 [Mesorhizobium sp. ORS 3324]|nr:hypothetical protein MPLB_1820092 [Mesorhizobium sp. ORS 3324]